MNEKHHCSPSFLSFVKVIEALDHFPSENVDYTQTPANQIQLIVDLLTSHVMKYARMSLDGDHQLLFNAIMCLAIQKKSEEHFSEEELSLLTQGDYLYTHHIEEVTIAGYV